MSEIKLNIGCGETKLPGFINIDIESSTNPDVICDVRSSVLPYERESVDEIYCIHNLEHIEMQHWPHVLTEFNRVLKIEGLLVLMYPEFEVCSQFFLENKRGMRDFWRACLYGRQLYPGDYHVVPMVSSEIATHLRMAGFHDIKYLPEDQEPQYTVLKARKSEELITKETLLRKELFGIEKGKAFNIKEFVKH